MQFSKKCKKPSILGIFDHFGSKWPIFDRCGLKCPKTSIHAKNQGNPICGFRKNAENLRFWAFLTILAQILDRRVQNDKFSSFPEKSKNVTFLRSLRLAFMHKIREIQYVVYEKMRKTFDLGIFDHFGSNFEQMRPKMTNFRVFLKKAETSPFYTP